MKARHIILVAVTAFIALDLIIVGGYWLLKRGSSTVTVHLLQVTNASAALVKAPAQVQEGFTFKRKGQFPEAVAAFEAAIREQPGYSDSYHGLAQTLREMGDPGAALANHDRAIELDPGRFDLYWERGVTCQRMNDYDAAITNYEACLERNSKFGNAHLGLGESYRAKGDFAKALEHLNQAIALKPDSDWFYRERGNTYRKMGEQQLAEADFAMVRELQQNKK